MPQRVGLIIPSSNRMVEQEMVGYFPGDVIAHINRLRMTGANRKPLSELLPEVESACAALVDAKCDVIAFHCTANSMSEGSDGEGWLLEALRRAGAPAVATTSTAVMNALNALNARRIALIAPYSQHATEEEAHFLTENGIATVHVEGCSLGGSDTYCSMPMEFWSEKAYALPHKDFDALFLSCANIRCMGIIDEIEARIGRPVITSNQVVVWDALRRIGWRGSEHLPGALFATGK
jgi:maleate isomerase